MELNLKNDVIFKAFFTKKGNEKYLKSFLESILKETVDEIEIIGEASLERIKTTDKLGRLDIKATINNNKVVNIEIQVRDNKDMKQRSEFYGSKLITEQIGKGDNYKEIKPVILINILDYNMLDVPEYYTKTVTVADRHREYEVIKDITYYFIELPKFRKSKPKLANELEGWLAIIDDKDGGLVKMAQEKHEIIKEAKEEVEEILSAAIVKELNELRQTAIWEENSARHYGREQGMKEGRKEGREEGIKEIAKEMLKEGIEIEKISKITKLTIQEIEKLNN